MSALYIIIYSLWITILAVFVSKIIKLGGNFTKFCQKIILLVFGTWCTTTTSIARIVLLHNFVV